MGLTVTLALNSRDAGPITVWAKSPTRSLGAAVIRAGDPGMIYGLTVDGPVTIQWRFPGRPIQQKVIDIQRLCGTPRLIIDADGARLLPSSSH
jgi:hypothetical protein